MTQNIDLFNKYVAIILSQLYENFPIKRDLDGFQISGFTVEECVQILASEGAEPKEVRVACYTIEWLVENGYIRALHGSYNLFQRCGLTEKGLAVLRSTPASLQQPDETFGDSLVRLLKEGSMDAAKGMVTQLLTPG